MFAYNRDPGSPGSLAYNRNPGSPGSLAYNSLVLPRYSYCLKVLNSDSSAELTFEEASIGKHCSLLRR